MLVRVVSDTPGHWRRPNSNNDIVAIEEDVAMIPAEVARFVYREENAVPFLKT
jgi:hypothetical protein